MCMWNNLLNRVQEQVSSTENGQTSICALYARTKLLKNSGPEELYEGAIEPM